MAFYYSTIAHGVGERSRSKWFAWNDQGPKTITLISCYNLSAALSISLRRPSNGSLPHLTQWTHSLFSSQPVRERSKGETKVAHAHVSSLSHCLTFSSIYWTLDTFAILWSKGFFDLFGLNIKKIEIFRFLTNESALKIEHNATTLIICNQSFDEIWIFKLKNVDFLNSSISVHIYRKNL